MSNGVTTWGEYLKHKKAKQVTGDDGEVEDKAVKKAAKKTSRKSEG